MHVLHDKRGSAAMEYNEKRSGVFVEFLPNSASASKTVSVEFSPNSASASKRFLRLVLIKGSNEDFFRASNCLKTSLTI